MLTDKQRALAFAAVAVLVLCAFGWGIAEKEEIRTNGRTVLMELAPRDPRSIMQGDYMALSYKTDVALVSYGPRDYEAASKRGYAVFAPDANNIARFVRIDDGVTPRKQGEFMMRFHREYGRVRLVPDSFMFQEGLRSAYQPAHYGIFKVDDRGRILLVGLADDTQKELVAETHIKTE